MYKHPHWCAQEMLTIHPFTDHHSLSLDLGVITASNKRLAYSLCTISWWDDNRSYLHIPTSLSPHSLLGSLSNPWNMARNLKLLSIFEMTLLQEGGPKTDILYTDHGLGLLSTCSKTIKRNGFRWGRESFAGTECPKERLTSLWGRPTDRHLPLLPSPDFSQLNPDKLPSTIKVSPNSRPRLPPMQFWISSAVIPAVGRQKSTQGWKDSSHGASSLG